MATTKTKSAATQEDYLKELREFYWENGFSPDEPALERLAAYAELLVKENEKVNLVSRRDVAKIVENHVFISAFIAKHLPEKSSTFLDIGSGGGLPGVPLAIVRPDLRGVLVDSTKKKADALERIVDKLMLANLEVVNGRVESPEFIEAHKDEFDLLVSRATAPLIILMRYSLPLAKDRAHLFAMKGGDISEEFQKMNLKYAPHVRKATTYDLHYKPTNVKNEKDKKLVSLEIVK
jgi:16S rRNA (guanine527-N7)-methyltransferase